MASRAPPDYYAILEISEKATTPQIRTAYKRAALKTHPDRVPNSSPERPERTRRFQLVNDAFFILSDAKRRKEYDAQRRLTKKPRRTPSAAAPEEPPEEAGTASSSYDAQFSWAWDSSAQTSAAAGGPERQRAEDAQFQDAFEEMMREEGLATEGGAARPTGKFWGALGAVSGGALGFIVGNVPGLVAGAVAGNRLGAVRDTRGKSVYEVYQELPQGDRAKLLGELAVRVFSNVAGV